MNSLFEGAPMAVHSICTSPETPPVATHVQESHVPHRPFLGRIEHSRFGYIGAKLDRRYDGSSRRRLRKKLQEVNASAVHIIAHGYPFIAAYLAAKDLGIPVLLTLHDDVRYMLAGHPAHDYAEQMLGEAWRDSAVRIMISLEMGEEYCKRYGERPFIVVTDGLDKLAPINPAKPAGDKKIVYFMGLLHFAYMRNIEGLLTAIRDLAETGENWHMVTRCGLVPLPFSPELLEHVTLLPYGSQDDVLADMVGATALYQPLGFGEQFDNFNKYSMSAKMVTYLGSGKPILFHGPEDSAAGRLLARWDAAEAINSLDPAEISAKLKSCAERTEVLAENAQKLAKNQFMLDGQRKIFWDAVESVAIKRSNVA